MIILGTIGLYLAGFIIAALMLFNGPTLSPMAQMYKPGLFLLADFRMTLGAWILAFFVALVQRQVFGAADGALLQVQITAVVMSLIFQAFAIESALTPVFGWVLGPIAGWFAVGWAWRIGAC